MSAWISWLCLAIALLLNAAANILMKVGSKTAGELAPDASAATKVFHFLNHATIWAIVLFAANLLFYRKALDGLNISVAYPIMVSLGLIIVTAVAVFWPLLGERLSGWQVAGMVLIIVGVWLLARQ